MRLLRLPSENRRTTSRIENGEIIRQASLMGPAIAAKIATFAKRASVVDAKFREGVLMRVVGIHDMFVPLFSDGFSDDSMGTSEVRRVEESISGMLRFVSIAQPLVLHIRLLSNVYVQDGYAACRQVFSRQRSSIFYVLQHSLVTPILHTQDSLFRVMDVLVHETNSHELRKFQSILAWAAAAWEGMLSVSEKTTVDTDDSIMDYEYIVRLGHDLTLNQLCRDLEEPLDELLQAHSEGAEHEKACSTVMTKLTTKLKYMQEESHKRRQTPPDSDDLPEDSSSQQPTHEELSERTCEGNRRDRSEPASLGKAEEELSLAKKALADQRRHSQEQILGKMSAVASVFDINKGWKYAQNAAQLMVVREIQRMLCVLNSLDDRARSDLGGPAEDLEHAGSCPFIATLQGASTGAVSSPLLQIPLYLAAYGGGDKPPAPVLKGSSAEIFHVRVTTTPTNVVLRPGQVKIMFLFDHLAVLPVTAVLLHCQANTDAPGPLVRSMLYITGRHGCDRQNNFVNEMLQNFNQDFCDFVVAPKTLLEEPRSTGVDGLNENVFNLLCSLATCRLHHGRDFQEQESSTVCNFYVGEGVSGDVPALRQDMDERVRMVRNLPERNTPTSTSGTLHDVLEIFQSGFDKIQSGLQYTRHPPGQNTTVLRRLQVHIQQQSCGDRQAQLYRCAERAVPKSSFERARLKDLLESKAEAFPTISEPMLAVIDREPCAQTMVDRSRCAAKLLKNVQRLLTFVANFQRIKAHDSSIAKIDVMHRTLLPLVYDFKYNIMSPLVRAVVKEDDDLVIAHELGHSYFVEKQKQLDDLLHKLGVPSETLEKFGLSNILVDIADSLPGGHGEEWEKADTGLTQGRNRSTFESLVSHLRQKMELAKNMASPPRHLIAALNKHLEELMAYNASGRLGVSDDEIKLRKVAVNTLFSKLVEYEATLAAEDPVLSKLPKELLALKNLCRQIPQDILALTGNSAEPRVQPSKGDISENGNSARIALEMVAERNGIVKLIGLLPTTRDADARRTLHRQAVTLMLPALGSQDVEPQVLRQDVLLASAAKRARSLIDEPASRLLGNVSVLQEYFQICPESGDLTDKLQNAALSDVVAMASNLHAKRLNVLNVVNSFDGETLLRVCPVSVSIADVFGLTAIACPAIIDYCVRLQAAADSTLSRSFGSNGDGASVVDLPMVPPELIDAKPELVARTDLCIVSFIDGENKSEISEILLEAVVTIRKVVHAALSGGVASRNSEASDNPLENTRLRPVGIVSAMDEWIPLQTYFCCTIIELCGIIAEKTITRKDLADMLAKHMPEDQKLTTAVQEQKTLVAEHENDLKRATDELQKQELQLRNTSESSPTGTALLRSTIRGTKKEKARLDKELRSAKQHLRNKTRELKDRAQDQVRKRAEELHRSIKAIFSDWPTGSNKDTVLSAEEMYERIVTLPSRGRKSFLSDLCDAADASLKNVYRGRDLLVNMIDRNVADLVFSRLLHLFDICKLAMHGTKNTAACLEQYLATVETSGGLLCDFVAETAPRLEHIFTDLERIMVEAKRDCSDYDTLIVHTTEVFRSLEGLRDGEERFSYHRRDNSPSCAAARRSISTLVNTARIFCIRAVFVSLSDVRARQLHSDRLDESFKACWQEAVRLNDNFLLALNDHELVVELDLLRHQRTTVQAVLRGAVLHTAFGVASSPFELVCLLQKTIGIVDAQALAPAYATQLLVQDWLEPMALSYPTGARSYNTTAAATLDNVKIALEPVSHSRVLKDDTVINSSVSAHEFLINGVSGRVDSVADAVAYLDGTLMTWGAGCVKGMLRRFQNGPSPEQAAAAGRLTTVFQDLVRALIRHLLLMCSNSVRQQVGASVAGLQPLKERLEMANSRVLLTDDGDPDSSPMLNDNFILLIDSLRVNQRRHGEGDVAHLGTLQLEIRSEARFHGIAVPDDQMSGLAAAENLSDLLFVGTMDMCGPLQLLLKSTLDASTCCEMVRLYLDHALTCVEALYRPLADVVVSGKTRRANQGHTKLLQGIFEAEDTFVEHIVKALREKAFDLLPLCGTKEAPESNHYHSAQKSVVRATELAEELLREGQELLDIKYALKEAQFDKELASVKGTYREWREEFDREDTRYNTKVEERKQGIVAAENKVRHLLSCSDTTENEAPSTPQRYIEELMEKNWPDQAASNILTQAINDHCDHSVSAVVLRLRCDPTVYGKNYQQRKYKLDSVTARIGQDKKNIISGNYETSQTSWDFTIPLDRLDPENETQVHLTQRWVEDVNVFFWTLNTVTATGKKMVYQTNLGLTRTSGGVELPSPNTLVKFDHVDGGDRAGGDLDGRVSEEKKIMAWTPKASLGAAKSCWRLWQNVETALRSIPQQPTRSQKQHLLETPEQFRDKYGVRLEKERELEERQRGGLQGELLRGLTEKMPTLTGAMDNTIETLARVLKHTVSDDLDTSLRFERDAEKHAALQLCFDLVASCSEAIHTVQPLLNNRFEGVVVRGTLTHGHLSQPAHALSTHRMVELRKDLRHTLHDFGVAMQSAVCMQWGRLMLLCIGIDAASAQGSAGIKHVLGELKRVRDRQEKSLAIWARQHNDPALQASMHFHCANICDNVEEILKRRHERMLLLHGVAKRAETLSSKLHTENLSMAFASKQARAHASIANIQVSPWVNAGTVHGFLALPADKIL